MCFPHAGGSANFFLPLSALLSAEVSVTAVQYPGRQDRHAERPAGSIGELAAAVAARLARHTGPLAFFGHSMGALVAFETARRLEGRVSLLVVSGRRPPTIGRPESVGPHDSDAQLLAKIYALGGTDRRVLTDPDIASLILPAVRADYRALTTYAHDGGAGLDCAVLSLVGESDPEVTVEEAADWRQLTSGPFESAHLPGGHFYLDQAWPEVARRLTVALRRSCADMAAQPRAVSA